MFSLIKHIKDERFRRGLGVALMVLFLVAAAAMLYGRVVFFDVVFFDDHLWVKDFYPYLSKGTHWWTFFGRGDLVTEVYYRPLLNLSFAVDARMGGGSPAAYHFTNVLLHVLNVCLVFSVLRVWGFKANRSFLAALIFLVHPALVQAVAWIPGRTDSLLGLFCFSGFLFYLKSLNLRRWYHVPGYAVCLAAALLTKETAVALGVMVVFWEILRPKTKGWREIWPVLSATGVVYLVWFLVRSAVLPNVPKIPLSMMAGSFVHNLPAIWDYLGKTFLPFHLSVFPMLEEARLIYGGLALGILIVLSFGVMSKRKRWERQELTRALIWAAAWFVLFLMPSLILSDLEYEYRLYVPLLGALIFMLELCPRRTPRFLSAGAVILVLVFAWMSFHYTESFRDRWTFWIRAADEAPRSALAQKNLGSMYYLKGDDVQAETYYRKALKISPKEKMVNNNLGLIYQNRNDFPTAIEFYQKEIQYYPNYELPYYNWSLLLVREQKIPEAVTLMKKALQLNPLLTEGYAHLIQMHLFLGEDTQAQATARRLVATGATIPPHVLETARRKGVNLLE